jgi:hypothetical protein
LLLNSDAPEDNIVSILAHLGNEREAVQQILHRIAESEASDRGPAVGELLILAGLRNLSSVVEEEIQQMPILDDIMDHPVIGRKVRNGIALGRLEGERTVILRQIDKRFGAVPEWAKARIETMSGSDLEKIELRLLDATDLNELLN